MPQIKALVIEDNPQMGEMVRDFIHQKYPGSDVTLYTTGESALNDNVIKPDVIIMDYQLDSAESKALSGLQILMKIKKKYDAPVIFLTGQERTDVAASIMKYGAYDYVVKNQQSFSKLESILNTLLAERSSVKPPKKNRTIGIAITFVVILAVVLLLLNMLR
jgi:DNA-binding NarL/FixJ family response regulator